MTRLVRSLVVSTLLLMMPGIVSAAGISIKNVSSTGASTAVLEAGDVLTVDLVLENATNLDIYGIGLLVNGYDPDRNGIADSGLVYQSGAVASSVFNMFVNPGPPASPVGGLPNVRTEPVEQWDRNVFDPEELRLSLADAASLSAAYGDGSLDFGVDGFFVGDGDVHFRVSFQATSLAGLPPSDLTLLFGNDAEYGAITVGQGGVTLPFTNATLDVRIVPEPGTALLMGLGLIGLASNRRR